jgi:hypothetical protein
VLGSALRADDDFPDDFAAFTAGIIGELKFAFSIIPI